MENAQPLQEFGEILLDVAHRDAGVDHRIQCCSGYAFVAQKQHNHTVNSARKAIWNHKVHTNAQPVLRQVHSHFGCRAEHFLALTESKQTENRDKK